MTKRGTRKRRNRMTKRGTKKRTKVGKRTGTRARKRTKRGERTRTRNRRTRERKIREAKRRKHRRAAGVIVRTPPSPTPAFICLETLSKEDPTSSFTAQVRFANMPKRAPSGRCSLKA
jgi:hypothetical protein